MWWKVSKAWGPQDRTQTEDHTIIELTVLVEGKRRNVLKVKSVFRFIAKGELRL